MPSSNSAPLRVLVVDDSAYNRQTLTDMLEGVPGVTVVGRAMDGKEALRLAFELEPDAITLDLEMPEMDGFAFLRLLMRRKPTPVIVISGYAERDNVFRALELGALDFIAKPTRSVTPELRTIAADLAEKIGLVRKLQVVRLRDRAEQLAAVPTPAPAPPVGLDPPVAGDELCVVGIAASTGGPPAIHQLLSGLSPQLPLAVVVAQHMPARFTKAFAERLDRVVPFEVREARDAETIRAGVVYVAPGSSNVEIELPSGGAEPVLRVRPPAKARPGGPNPLTPSADRMFESMVAAYGARMCALVLTGMGSDGARGAKTAHRRGAYVLVEDPETAVMPGMPQSAIATGVADDVLPLERLAGAIVRFVKERG